ncbi:MAG: hypothetical protein J6W52_08880 [Bacteroidaceae bacterium]|nr:hypothetical protein [Bacteroidaceae bacterium]
MAKEKKDPIDSYGSKEKLYDKAKVAYYCSPPRDFILFNADTFEMLPLFKFKFDMIFADPPYFLSSGGISVQSGKIVCVDKGDWDKSMSSEEINEFNLKWLSLCREKLKDNGTIWISGTYHNIFSVANCLTQLGYKILNKCTKAKDLKIFMYAVAPTYRKESETFGRLAIDVKNDSITEETIKELGYIMFHYWNNEKATLYKLIKKPHIVNKIDIPDGYLLRIEKDSERFILLEYNPEIMADLGECDIRKVQRKGKERYLPFITSLQNIICDDVNCTHGKRI